MSEVYSFTKFRDWRCPLRGKTRRINKLKEPETDPLLVGRACANIMRAYRKWCYTERRESDLESLRNLAQVQVSGSPEHLRDEILDVIDRVTNSPVAILDMSVETPLIEQMAALSQDGQQYWFEYPDRDMWSPWGKAWLRLVPDFMCRIGRIGVIEDDKAGWSRSPDPLQLRIYAWAASRIFAGKIDSVVVRFNYLRMGYRDFAQWGIDEVAEFYHEIASEAERIERLIQLQDFHANVDAGLCEYCGYLNDNWLDKKGNPANPGECPGLWEVLELMDSLTELKGKKIETIQDAEDATRILVLRDAGLIGPLKKGLEAFLRENGDQTVVAAGKRAHIAERSTMKVKDLQEVVRVLQQRRIDKSDIWNALTLNKSNLEKLARKEPHLIDELVDLGLISFSEKEELAFKKA